MCKIMLQKHNITRFETKRLLFLNLDHVYVYTLDQKVPHFKLQLCIIFIHLCPRSTGYYTLLKYLVIFF